MSKTSALWILLRQWTPYRIRKPMRSLKVSSLKDHKIHTLLMRLHLLSLLAHTPSPTIPCPCIRNILKGWLWMNLSIINIANLIVDCCAHLAARYHKFNPDIGDGGSHNTKVAATSRGGSQGWAFDHKQALPGGNPYFFQSSIFFFFKNKNKQINKSLLSNKINLKRASRLNSRTPSLRVFLSYIWLVHTCVPTTHLFSYSAKYPVNYNTHDEWRAPEKVESNLPQEKPGGQI